MFNKKSYETIVAPLKKVKSELFVYMGDQQKSITNLVETKNQINLKINIAEEEIKKSEDTLSGIEGLIDND